MKTNKYFSIILLSWLFQGVGVAHDLNGLLVTKTLPSNIREEIEAREKLRSSAGKKILDSNLPATERKEIVKSLGLPARFESPEAVVSARALWPQKTKLMACFFDGNQESRKATLTILQEVAELTNLNIDSDIHDCQSQPSHIRISFRQVGYWSYVGTDALLIDKSRPTMGLQNLDLQLPLDEQRTGIIRHEVMHALGALHEHQHPGASCAEELDWDRVAVSLGWNSQQMKTNFEQLLFGDEVITNKYDKSSIMHYQLPATYWKYGAIASCYLPFSNTKLSEGDKQMLKAVYPK